MKKKDIIIAIMDYLYHSNARESNGEFIYDAVVDGIFEKCGVDIEDIWNPRIRIAYVSQVKELIDKAPTIEAEPIRHSHWDDDSVMFYRKCPECGRCVEWNKNIFLDGNGEYNFCPNCGAKMNEVIK